MLVPQHGLRLPQRSTPVRELCSVRLSRRQVGTGAGAGERGAVQITALDNARRSDSTVALSSALAEALVALEAGQGPQGHHRRRDAYGVIVTPEISHGGWKAGETEPFSRGRRAARVSRGRGWTAPTCAHDSTLTSSTADRAGRGRGARMADRRRSLITETLRTALAKDGSQAEVAVVMEPAGGEFAAGRFPLHEYA
jgi:hypothetical protein